MKEYDIFLKRRLTESKLFIYSIPYRDGISVTHRVILEAMLQYYTLQKAVALENKSALVSEIDEIVNIVHERVGSTMELSVSADLLAQSKAELDRTAIEIDIPNLPTFLSSFITVRDALGITVSNIDTFMKSSLGNQLGSALGIVTDPLSAEEIMFGEGRSDLLLKARIKRTHKQAFEVVQDAIEIDMPSTNLFYSYRTGVNAMFSLAAYITETELRHSLGAVQSSIEIATSNPETFTEKRIEVVNEIRIFCDLSAVAVSFMDGGSEAELQISTTAGLKRYRLLKEYDDLSLDELDDTKLDDMDYMWLT